MKRRIEVPKRHNAEDVAMIWNTGIGGVCIVIILTPEEKVFRKKCQLYEYCAADNSCMGMVMVWCCTETTVDPFNTSFLQREEQLKRNAAEATRRTPPPSHADRKPCIHGLSEPDVEASGLCWSLSAGLSLVDPEFRPDELKPGIEIF